MSEFLALGITGLITGCIYAIAACGLVVTYTTSGVFNFAHGAVGMLCAYVYWTLSVQHGWPVPLAILVVLLVMAPLLGAVIERVLIRPLGVGTTALSMTVTLGLLVLFVGMAATIWSPQQARSIPHFFSGRSVRLFDTTVTWHQLIIVICAIAVAIGLRLFLYHTRPGVTMRATVDDPSLVRLSGAPSSRYSQFGWMLGSFLAGLAGLLLAPLVNLDIQTLTLLVVNAYAAALLGRLKNLPMTFVGGLALGLANSYAIGYLPEGALLSEVGPIIPMVFLFIVLLVFAERRLETSVTRFVAPRVPGLRESLIAAAVLIVVGYSLTWVVSESTLQHLGYSVAIGLVLLSMVPLTGYAGQISLCQFTFAGIGAVVMSRFGAGDTLTGLIAGTLAAAIAGVIIALPALRLRGLYLALLTLAFAQAMDSAFFNNGNVMGIEGAVTVGRVRLGFIPTQSDPDYFTFLVVVFAILAVAMLAVRRSRWGRYLVAISDSEVGATAFGMNLTLVKLSVFGGSAGLAGFAGALLGGQNGLVGPTDFGLLVSLSALLILTIMGTRTVTGALLGGISLGVFPIIQDRFSVLRDFGYLLTGLGAVSIVKNPNGAVGGDTPAATIRRRRLAAQMARENSAAEAAATQAVEQTRVTSA